MAEKIVQWKKLSTKTMLCTKLCMVLSTCMLLFVVCGFASKSKYIYDEANLYSSNEINQLESEIQSLIENVQCDIKIVTASYVGENTDQFIDEFFFEHDFGYGSSRRGVVFFIDMDNRQFRIFDYDDNGEFFFSDEERELIADDIMAMLGAGQYMDGAMYFLERVQLQGESNVSIDEEQLQQKLEQIYEQYDIDNNAEDVISISLSSSGIEDIMIRLVVAMGVSGIFVGIIAFATNGKQKVYGGTYVKQDSMRINRKVDRYTHTTVVKRQIEQQKMTQQQNSSHHFGGGSSTHTTSSGGRSSGGGF